MTIEELDAKMSEEFAAVRTKMSAEFAAVGAYVDARITAEGETTGRHFDVVSERFREYTRVLVDGTARNTERLDDHEKRISTIESRRS
jgi:BMFP domain-containing protein YqiC